MPLFSSSLTSILVGNMSAIGIIGSHNISLARAISNGFVSYLKSSVVLTTVDAGAAGSGAGLGQGLFLAPSVLQGSLSSSFAGNGLIGTYSLPLIFAISNSISQALATTTLIATHVGVGAGTGIVTTLIPNTAAHIGSLTGSFAGQNILGVYSSSLIRAISVGIDSSLPTSRGLLVITGGSAPPPSSGVGIGRVS